ncbi:MAG: class I SAM-dependent methyltransferase [Desulfobacula sp.]|nr:class I SAM-dependent methyltransferase [Desulfobacula sp.]MCD4719210.1 class I SAM-dependent methyltransferase [Desulfobacula sp.]
MQTDYDFSAKIYDPVLYLALKPIRIAVMNELLNHKNKSILDLCCGTGNQLKLLSKNGFKNLHCLDLSTSMLKIANKGDYPINIYNEDATKTSFENESFDIAIISFAIHEKTKTTQEKFIKEAHRLINEDGFILVVDYAFDNKTPEIVKKGIDIIERLAGREHYNNFKSYIQNNGLANLMNKNKFKLLKHHKRLFNGVTISRYKKDKALL